MTLIGVERQWAEMAAGLASGRLHHGWLLSGPKGVGKAGFAKLAAQAIIEGAPYHFSANSDSKTAQLIAARSHPDFRLVEREVWDGSPPRIVPYDRRKADDPIARSIRIAQIRALEPILSMPPALADRRVIIIDAADDLERPAANALLKMLEEPPASTTFMLISHVAGRLLPTIRSRCRVLRFAPLDEAGMQAALAGVEGSAADKAAAIAGAEGSPGRAIAALGNRMGEIDATLRQIARDGDRDNRLRSTLARSLFSKAQAQRYEAFLSRVPAFIADEAKTRQGEALNDAIEHWSAARHLAAIALPQSLSAETVAFEMLGHVAALARR
jgi:DNA polymerase-3 subunit delta'